LLVKGINSDAIWLNLLNKKPKNISTNIIFSKCVPVLLLPTKAMHRCDPVMEK
jgi:hypothetical protein